MRQFPESLLNADSTFTWSSATWKQRGMFRWRSCHPLPSDGISGLDQFSWTNVLSKYTNRYWAHLALAVVVVLLVCCISRLELLTYTLLRHRWLASYGRLVGTSTTTTSTILPRVSRAPCSPRTSSSHSTASTLTASDMSPSSKTA